MLTYPAKFKTDDNGAILVTFPDVPGAITFGYSEQDALAHAVDALETMLMAIIEDRDPIPAPSRLKRGQKSVRVPALSEAKLNLYQAMRAEGVGKAELARRLNCHLPQVDRLLDLCHASRLEQLEAAFRALGKRLCIVIEDAA
jgi:antitoxin HicB